MGAYLSKENKLRFCYGLPILGGLILSVALVSETLYIISVLGLPSIFQKLDLTSSMKVFISLYLFLGFSSVTLLILGAYLQWKGYARFSFISNAIGVLSALITLAIPPAYGFNFTITSLVGTIISACLIVVGSALSLTIPPVAKVKAPLLTSVEVSTVAVFSASYAIMILTFVIPSPTGGYTHIGDTIVFIAALLFGYRVGGLVGIVGAVVADLYTGYSRWYVSILAHGVEGLIAGLGRGRSIVVQVIMCMIGGFLMASTYFLINIFIKGFPLAVISYGRDLFAQAAVSMVLGLVIVNIVKRVLPRFRV